MELTNLIYTEKYRPSSFDDLVSDNKGVILNYLKHPLSIPSFIFHSVQPGTGKTSTAKLIIKELGCDSLSINSSDERGIDTIREKIATFSRSLSTSAQVKRCIFLDEADGLTKQAQDSLRNLMETYADNCFFIFSCNDLSKIIEPIRSRCVALDFTKPSKEAICTRLIDICEKEDVGCSVEELNNLVNQFYPDIRSMVMAIQRSLTDKKPLATAPQEYEEAWEAVKKEDVAYLYAKAYSPDFNVLMFNKWIFCHLFNNHKLYKVEQCREIALRLADTEKAWNLGANIEIVFLANILQIAKLVKHT
jgi:DNA polymerase III delta prime subunit